MKKIKLIKKHPTRLNIPSAGVICIALLLTFPVAQAAGQSLDNQKSRLLERIIETEDDALRERLLKIYESMEEKSSITPESAGAISDLATQVLSYFQKAFS